MRVLLMLVDDDGCVVREKAVFDDTEALAVEGWYETALGEIEDGCFDGEPEPDELELKVVDAEEAL